MIRADCPPLPPPEIYRGGLVRVCITDHAVNAIAAVWQADCFRLYFDPPQVDAFRPAAQTIIESGYLMLLLRSYRSTVLVVHDYGFPRVR